MKIASGIVCCAFLAGLSIDSASAYPITVRVAGHVIQMQDSTGMISPQVSLSQPVTAIYTYDTAMPLASGGGLTTYAPSTDQASIAVNIGPFVFQSGSASQLEVIVTPQGMGKFDEATFWFNAFNNPPLSNGIPVAYTQLVFFDSTGLWPASTSPPASAPSLANFADSKIFVGNAYGTSTYSITAQVDSVILVLPMEVSPAWGSFLPQQHFDAAVF